jgi:UDP-N-acetylglucosamine diphosphorylase/glucosamine-1-phosphate N-acetyltransferase
MNFARLVRFTPTRHDYRKTGNSSPLDWITMIEACAVVLAAGKGTRMKSELPKVLCQVCGRAMIHFVVDALEKAGIERQIIVVGYEAEAVKRELSSRSSKLEFVYQTEQLGTGHAVQMAAPALAGHQGLTVVVAGDSPLIQSSSLIKLRKHFDSKQPALLLGTLEKDNPTGLGRIVRGPDGEFWGIVEHKDATEAQRQIREVNMSTYFFRNPDLLQALGELSNENAQGEYYLTDSARLMRESGKRVEALAVLEPCESLSINNPEELQLVDEKMRAMGYA